MCRESWQVWKGAEKEVVPEVPFGEQLVDSGMTFR